MSLQYNISLITMAETLPLRQKVLKPFRHIEDCINLGDESATTYHLGLYHGGRLVSVATYLLESHPYFLAGHPYRLRGMATQDKYRGQGLGQALMMHGVTLLREKRCDFIWCNARLRAFSFYEKLGFQYAGPLFDIADIGPHKVMYKHLIPR